MSFIETLSQEILEHDQNTQKALCSLQGQCLGFYLPGYELHYRVLITSVGTLTPTSLPPDVSIEGSLLDLVRFALTQDPHISLHISGKTDLAFSLQRIAKNACINWHGLLTKHLGLPLASLLLTPLPNRSMPYSVPLWLQHEKKYLPTSREVDTFCESVDTLKNRIERLCALLKT